MSCKTGGCSSEGSSGCNKKNTFDWFADIPIASNYNFNIIEVSFKQGARKGFYRNDKKIDLYKGDLVLVEAAQGYDIGEVSLKGELVKLQMKKKKVKDTPENVRKIIKKATELHKDELKELRSRERDIMIKARVISRELKLNMKVGDIEFQGDGKKATIYYTSEGRIDFRELVKRFVSEFKIKIEMRQIGARQEAARIGGMGSCGRELCCSSWMSDFKSVTTGAARYQQLSINTDKLSGQCGRLKCCLNYELDTYMDAIKNIPKKADKLKTKEGLAVLRKTDVFTREMTYLVRDTNKFFKISADDVHKIKAMNKEGEMPASLLDFNIENKVEAEKEEYEDLVGQVNLKTLEKKPNKNRNKRRKKGRNQQNKNAEGQKANPQKKNNNGGEKKSDSQNNQQQGQQKSNNKKRKNRNFRRKKKD